VLHKENSMKTSKIAAAAILAASLFVIGCEEEKKNTMDAAKGAADSAAKSADAAKDAAKDAAGAAKDAAGSAKDAAKDTAKDAGNMMSGMAGDAMAKMKEAMGGDPSELLKKAEALIGEGKLPDAKAILEKIKPYVDKLPADLQTKAKELIGKVGL
jgi:hypothetical protein